MIISSFCLLSFMLASCSTNEYLINAVIKIQGSDEKLIIMISALDTPQYIDFQSGGQYFLYDGKDIEVQLEKDINYNIEIYSTTNNVNTENKVGDHLSEYIKDQILVKEKSFDNQNKEIIIEL